MAPEMLQELYFSQSAFGQYLLAKHICNLFDGNALTRVYVGSGTA